MSVKQTFRIEGLAELDKMLSQLSKSMSRTVLRNALKKAGKPIADAATASVPVGKTGNLRRSIKISTKLKKSQYRYGRPSRVAVDVFVGSSAPHAHLVEFGTGPRRLDSPRAVNLGGKVVMVEHTGQMPARPFLRPAWDLNKEKAVKIFGEEVWKELTKAARRLRIRAERGTLGKRQVEALLK